MSLSVVYTRAAIGVKAPLISVEVHLSNGLPGLTLVGLPETTVKEARDRVRSAIINSGYTFPAKKITINLAPADLPKEGGRYDLPIAIALLAASEQLNSSRLGAYEFIGELALTGALRGVPGAISGALEAIRAGRQIIVANENGAEVSLIAERGCLLAGHLQEVCAYLEGQHVLSEPEESGDPLAESPDDLSDIYGQEQGKRALEITAAGGHNLLLIGPPGTGKTMLASRLNGLLPPLNNHEALESAAIFSLVSSVSLQKQWRRRPFRSPHHSASLAAMVGGGTIPGPGEISLAHNGILFLDELPEFERRVLDALREPIESGHYQGNHNRSTPEQTLRYLGKLSGPFLDRFDLSLEIPLPPPGLLNQSSARGESTVEVRERVIAAQARQYMRQHKLNARLDNAEIRQFCPLKTEDSCWLEDTLTRFGLSIRAWQRLIKVARTIADVEKCPDIERRHLQEALSYRAIDRLLLHLQKLLA